MTVTKSIWSKKSKKPIYDGDMDKMELKTPNFLFSRQAKILDACGAPNTRKLYFYMIFTLKTDGKPHFFPPAADQWLFELE